MLAPTRLAFIPKAPTSISLPESQAGFCPLCLQYSLHLKNKSSGPGCSEDGCSHVGGAPGAGLPQAKGAVGGWGKSWRSSLDMVLLLPFPKGNLNWNMDEHDQGSFSPFCCYPGLSTCNLLLSPAPPDIPASSCLPSSIASDCAEK